MSTYPEPIANPHLLRSSCRPVKEVLVVGHSADHRGIFSQAGIMYSKCDVEPIVQRTLFVHNVKRCGCEVMEERLTLIGG